MPSEEGVLAGVMSQFGKGVELLRSDPFLMLTISVGGDVVRGVVVFLGETGVEVTGEDGRSVV